MNEGQINFEREAWTLVDEGRKFQDDEVALKEFLETALREVAKRVENETLARIVNQYEAQDLERLYAKGEEK